MVNLNKKVVPTFEIKKDIAHNLDHLDSGTQTFYVI